MDYQKGHGTCYQCGRPSRRVFCKTCYQNIGAAIVGFALKTAMEYEREFCVLPANTAEFGTTINVRKPGKFRE